MGNSIRWLPWLRFFRAFSSVVRQMPGFNSQSRCTVRTLKLVVIVLCYRLYSCAVVILLLLFVFVLLLFVLFYVLKLCVLQHCHRVLTQLQSSNIYIYLVGYIKYTSSDAQFHEWEILYFLCGLFYETVINSDNVILNVWFTDKQWKGKDLKGSKWGLTESLSQYLPERSEENCVTHQSW